MRISRAFFLALFFLFSAGLAQAAATASEQLKTLLGQAAAAYGRVNDYHAVFRKQELRGGAIDRAGALGPKETIFLKFEKPFKIFMHWSDTRKKGLQVLYERGRHDGKLAIHKPGLMLGLVPVVFLPQNSPWVREGSESYDIEDAGIGTFLEDFSVMVLRGEAEGKLNVSTARTPLGTNADVSFPGSVKDKDYFASRVEVLFDEKTKLPVRMTLYDWEGRVTGVYEYDQLALNIGADDPEFKRLAQKRLYKLYLPPAKIVRKANFTPR